nr:hypothetical protein CFP56_43896 [Quercus suber]
MWTGGQEGSNRLEVKMQQLIFNEEHRHARAARVGDILCQVFYRGDVCWMLKVMARHGLDTGKDAILDANCQARSRGESLHSSTGGASILLFAGTVSQPHLSWIRYVKAWTVAAAVGVLTQLAAVGQGSRS